MKLTELEQDFMNAICEDKCMYLDHIEGYLKKVKINQISGVVSSLVKKGLIESDYDTDPDFSDLIIINITKAGMSFSIFK